MSSSLSKSDRFDDEIGAALFTGADTIAVDAALSVGGGMDGRRGTGRFLTSPIVWFGFSCNGPRRATVAM